MQNYHLCILTAANETQANGYRSQLAWRRERGMLPDETEFLVISDPAGRRVGSGGSTLHVLHQLLQCADGDFERAFGGQRILILHSGGDSKRLPAYSAMGKVFMPLPSERYFAVFDVLLDNFARLPVLPDGQVIIASGDVLLTFDPDAVAFSETGVVGVAYPDLPEVASRHGVYVSGRGNQHVNPRKVLQFLQKPSLQTLQSKNVLDLSGRAFVDTGILHFGLDAVERLLTAEDAYRQVLTGAGTLDLYLDIPLALLGIEGGRPIPELSGTSFAVSLLPYCGFFHIGRSVELLQNFHTLTHAALEYGFHPFTRSDAETLQSHASGENPSLERVFLYNSHCEDIRPLRVDGPAFVEGCVLEASLTLAGNNVLTGLSEGCGDIELQRGVGLSVIPLRDDGWVALLYGMEDSFKGCLGTADGTFLNSDMREWMRVAGLSSDTLWGAADDVQAMWEARLFPVSDAPARAVQAALALQHPELGIAAWRALPRISLAEALEAADHTRLLRRYSGLESASKRRHLASWLTPESEVSAEEVLSWCETQAEKKQLTEALQHLIAATSNLLFCARLYKLLSKLDDVANEDAETLESRAFTCVRRAIGQGLQVEETPGNAELAIRSDEVVWACTPVRLDFAGGWSDTPPYSLEHGGTVLNAAVQLNGQYPIQVIGKRLEEPVIRINSIDLAQNTLIMEMEDLLAFDHPGDWLSLPKSAFVAAGILPYSTNGSPSSVSLNAPTRQPADPPTEAGDLTAFLKRAGGGIDLTLFSAVPSGSGLGTSSILGSALIACLGRMFGRQFDPESIFNRTLYMEQLMTTGGGWQDQIGGVVGGVKLICTEPGLYPMPTFSWTELSPPALPLSDRFLLYYTGYRRMAKNILQQIVGKYLERDHMAVETIRALQALARDLKEALDHRDIDRFGEGIRQAWELNKRLDPGTSTPEIEQILDSIAAHIIGAKLLGAGGGGFLFMVTRGPEHSQAIRQQLQESPPNPRARFFEFSVDLHGLKVNVL